MEKLKNILHYTVVWYLAVIVLFLKFSDQDLMQRQRQRYLLGIFVNRGLTSFQDGVLYFDSMVTAHPNDAQSWAGLGASYYSLKQYEQAIRALEKAVEFNPDSQEFAQQLSWAHKKLNDINLNFAQGK